MFPLGITKTLKIAKYHDYIDGKFSLADGGLDATLFFNDCTDLHHFVVFNLMKLRDRCPQLCEYFVPYINIPGQSCGTDHCHFPEITKVG
jgi:hypothetical protein